MFQMESVVWLIGRGEWWMAGRAMPYRRRRGLLTEAPQIAADEAVALQSHGRSTRDRGRLPRIPSGERDVTDGTRRVVEDR